MRLFSRRRHIPLLAALSAASTFLACGSGDDATDPGPGTGTEDAGPQNTKVDASTPGTDSGTPQASTVTIGGTVAGLAGSGLVLSDGKNELPITAQGAFWFPTPVAKGSAYAVTIKTQPSSPKQTCTVTNGSGTANADVTNIAVNCNTDTFTLGGTATGVAATAVLQNNAGDDLNVTASGAFTFATPVKSGATFAVTVKTQPASPTQTCVVTDGSGTMGAAAVTSVKLTCTTNTYTVKAAVTGATGALVLQNNAGDDLAVAADGTVSFATKVESGKPYAVTVKTHPAGQLCAVTSGSGNVTNADVTANVTCQKAYTIGGTVVDLLGPLTGAGLVLQNNGANNLAIAQAGPFSFGMPVVSGGAYAVSVFTQPNNPTRTCSVANAAGNAAANVSNVVVTCGWGAIPAFPADEVDPNAGYFNGFGQIAWDDNGDILLPPYGGGALKRIARANGAVTDIGGAFPAGALGIAYDPTTKMVYVGNGNNNNVYKYDLAQPAVAATVLGTTTGSTHTLAIAPAGFGGFGGYVVAATASGRVVFMKPSNGVATTYTTTGTPNGLAFSSDKTFYVQSDNGTIVKMATDGTTTPFANIGTSCDGIVLDEGRGAMYVACSGGSAVRKVTLVGATVTTLPGAVNFDGGYWPSPFLFDGNNKLVVGITSNGQRLRQYTLP